MVLNLSQNLKHILRSLILCIFVALLTINFGQIRGDANWIRTSTNEPRRTGWQLTITEKRRQNDSGRPPQLTQQTNQNFSKEQNPIAQSIYRFPSSVSSSSKVGRTAYAEPDSLPGTFVNNSLYLQGIRLTTSYEAPVDDLHVDLFGFPGDLTKVSSPGNKWMVCENVTNNVNETLWTRDEIKENVTLFCELNSSIVQQFADHERLIKMLFVPMHSLDGNQNLASPFLWRCNVTEILNKPKLLAVIDGSSVVENKTTASLSVHIWMQYGQASAKSKIATFQIPLDTGTLGVGSTQHTQSDRVEKSYFHKPPVATGLCVAVHGTKPLRYLSQFVQHHLNAGFHSIVIGVKGSEDSNELKAAQNRLARYIDQGVVTLAYYNAPFGAQVGPTKLQFYQSCLYYYKGLAKYVATWDIDEYWLPPDTLDVNGRHNHHHIKLGEGLIRPQNQELETNRGLFINSSSWSTFSRFVQQDLLWQRSRYARSVSISDTMDAIDRYYVEHGCVASFCYHAFSSRDVTLQNSWNRTTRIGQDFALRQREYNAPWLKSVVNTKQAHSVGFHYGGSCSIERYLNASLPSAELDMQFHRLSHNPFCYPRRFEHEVYGSIHHFFALLAVRHTLGVDNITEVDEYGAFFASTVERQIERDDPSAFDIKGVIQ